MVAPRSLSLLVLEYCAHFGLNSTERTFSSDNIAKSWWVFGRLHKSLALVLGTSCQKQCSRIARPSPSAAIASEEDNRTRPITYQNRELWHIDINLKLGIGIEIISYTSTIASPLYLSLLFGNRYCFCSTSDFEQGWGLKVFLLPHQKVPPSVFLWR